MNGGIGRRMGSGGITNFADVPSVDEVTQKILSAGGRALGSKMTTPSVGYMAVFEDTEGNRFGILEADPTAG